MFADAGTLDRGHTPQSRSGFFINRSRTRLATLLRRDGHSFSQLKKGLEITDGNLDAHLRKLSSAGYLHSRMVLDGRPHTVYELSESGTAAFDNYLASLQKIIEHARRSLKSDT